MYFLFVLIEAITHAINASLPTQWQFIDALLKEISWTGGNKFFKGILYCLSGIEFFSRQEVIQILEKVVVCRRKVWRPSAVQYEVARYRAGAAETSD